MNTDEFIDKFCIARCTSAGVHAGVVAQIRDDTVIMRDSRRLWYWVARDGIALSGVAQYGVVNRMSKIDATNPIIYLTGVCELIPCTDTAKESIL